MSETAANLDLGMHWPMCRCFDQVQLSQSIPVSGRERYQISMPETCLYMVTPQDLPKISIKYKVNSQVGHHNHMKYIIYTYKYIFCSILSTQNTSNNMSNICTGPCGQPALHLLGSFPGVSCWPHWSDPTLQSPAACFQTAGAWSWSRRFESGFPTKNELAASVFLSFHS